MGTRQIQSFKLKPPPLQNSFCLSHQKGLYSSSNTFYMKKLYIALFASLVFTTISFSQDTNSVSHISDNLGNTESSRAIYKGTLLTSLSIDYNELKYNSEYSDHSFKTLGAPIISVGYGLFKFMDFRLTYGLNHDRSYYSQDGSWSSYHSNIQFGSKINLFQQKKWIPELSYSLYYNSDEFVTNTLAFSHNLGENFRLGGNFGLRLYDLESKINPRQWSYSINARYEFFKGFGAFVDFKSQDQKFWWRTSSQIGVYYRLNNNMQFHLNGGKVFYSENNDLNEYFASGGFSWMLFGNK